MNIKRIYKDLNKINKELIWCRDKLKLLIKGLDKKKKKHDIDLGVPLRKGFALIGDTIDEFETELRKLRKLVLKNGSNSKSEIKYIPMRGEKDVYDVLVCSIKLNLRPETLIFILQSCFIKKKILILFEDRLAYLKDVIIEFFDFIFEESFEKKIEAITKGEYMKKEALYKDYLILSDNLVSSEKKNSVANNGTKFEEKIITDFYREPDTTLGRENLRYKLQELYALSKALLDFYKKRNIILVPKAAIKYLEDTFLLKIKKDYFYFLVRIVESYFDINIKYAKDYISKQIALMMRE